MTPEGNEFAACPQCGSSRVRPKQVIAGPILAANRGDNLFQCEECGYEGLLVVFKSEEDLDKFRQEKMDAAHDVKKVAETANVIPIIPLYSKPLLGSSILESVPFKSAEVVSVRWNGEKIEITDYNVDFKKYWTAVGGTKYRASTIYVFDMAGINKAEPSFQAMRELVKHDCEILFDLGASGPDDIMDGFMVDIEKVIASTKALKGPQDFGEIFTLSDDTIPCIDWDDGVVWAGGRRREPLEPLARMLHEIGYSTLIVMDLSRLGTWAGPSIELVDRCLSLDAEVYLGGGIKEEDAQPLTERGLKAALTDPYTPVLRDMVLTKPTGPRSTSVESPEVVEVKDVRTTPA